MKKLLVLGSWYVTLFCVPVLCWGQSQTPQSSNGRKRLPKCTQETKVWQDARYETIDGKPFWAPAQWVVKKVEAPCDDKLLKEGGVSQNKSGVEGNNHSSSNNASGKVESSNPNTNSGSSTRIGNSGSEGNNQTSTTGSAMYDIEKCNKPTLSDEAFINNLGQVENNTFETARFSAAKLLVQNNCLTVQQVIRIIKTLSLDDNRFELAKFALAFTFNRLDYYLVKSAFNYESTNQKMNTFLEQQKLPIEGTNKPGSQKISTQKISSDTEETHSHNHSEFHIHGCDRPEMPSKSLNILKTALQNCRAEATRRALAEQGTTDYCLSSNQVKDLMGTFTSENSRLEFAKNMYRNVYDPEEYFIIHEAFNSENSKLELSNYIKKLR